MAGNPPPPDAPSPVDTTNAGVDAGFTSGPSVRLLCGFAIPTFVPSFGFRLPAINFPPTLPTFDVSLGLSCELSNPLNVSAGISFGGARKPTGPADPDDSSQLESE